MLRRTLTLGYIAAIPVRLHWSWLIIFGLLLVMLRAVYAPTLCDPLLTCGSAWLIAAAVSLLIGGSVLLHELGHALVARRCQVPVHSITLFAFGGVAEVQAEAAEPSSEFAIAVAGPLTNLLIAVACGLSWLAMAAYDSLFPLALLVAHVGLANAIMAVFNLLPGYPMDGGRVLRAVLWFLNDDMLGATQIAARIGKLCGALLVLGGLLLALASQDLFAAVWMTIIGVFLYRTARSSYRQFLLHVTLNGVRVADLMQRNVRTVSPELTLEQFVSRYVLGHSDQGFPVVRIMPAEPRSTAEGPAGLLPLMPSQSPILVGMMTLRDMRRFTINDWPFTRVAEAMTPLHHVRALAPSWSAVDALHMMTETGAELLPVIEGPYLLGVLRRRDLALYIQLALTHKRS